MGSTNLRLHQFERYTKMADGLSMCLLACRVFTCKQTPKQCRLFLATQYIMACQFSGICLGSAAIVCFECRANGAVQCTCSIGRDFIAQYFLYDALAEHMARR